MTHNINRIIGVIPMAGQAKRLGNMPFSKELFPLGLQEGGMKVVSEHLMGNMIGSGADILHLVIRQGKWDIPAYFGSTWNSASIAYHVASVGYGVPFTVHQAYPFFRDNIVLLGFPDILFAPEDAYTSLIRELKASDAAVALGLFHVDNPDKYDMVELDAGSMIRRIRIKEKNHSLEYAWIIAAWKPQFSSFLNRFIHKKLKENSEAELLATELHFGHVLIEALGEGIPLKGVRFENGYSRDVGTPEDLQACLTERTLTGDPGRKDAAHE